MKRGVFKSEEFSNVKYNVSHPEVKKCIKAAASSFKEFKLTKNKDSLTQSFNDYRKARDLASQKSTLADQAYCLRKLATVIIRDESMNHDMRYGIAKLFLEQAEHKYEEFIQSSKNHGNLHLIYLEMQQTAALQCKVAKDLKDGDLLEKSATSLLKSLKSLPNLNYEIDGLISLYTVHFSRQELPKATEILNRLLECIATNPAPYITVFYLCAKANLFQLMLSNGSGLELFFKEKVQDKFWKAFDQHKKERSEKILKHENYNRETLLLKKDLMFMLVMKLAQRMQGFNTIKDNHPNESVCDYIVRQIHDIFGKNNSNERYLHKSLYYFVKEIEKAGEVCLAHRFFETKAPPSFKVDNFQGLLGDYKEKLLPDSHLGQSLKDEVPMPFEL